MQRNGGHVVKGACQVAMVQGGLHGHEETSRRLGGARSRWHAVTCYNGLSPSSSSQASRWCSSKHGAGAAVAKADNSSSAQGDGIA
jgi:hypothetical protein